MIQDYGFLKERSHRPWPCPSAPWVMPQRWSNLLFLHWPVSAAQLQPLLPPAFRVDTFEGSAWLGLVPFQLSYAPRGLHRQPCWVRFNELNLRTYVTVREPSGLERSGVYFFCLDATDLASVLLARTFFHLPYNPAAMAIHPIPGGVRCQSRRSEWWGRGEANLTVRYGPKAPLPASAPGSLEHFLTERYCFWTHDRKNNLFRGDIHHAPWPLHTAWADIEENTFFRAHGLQPEPVEPLAHFAPSLDVVAWYITRFPSGEN